MDYPWLTVMLFLPALGALYILLAVRKDNVTLVRGAATWFSVATFLISLALWLRFDTSSAAFQFAERYAWIPSLGITYHVGMDGISLLLVLLTTFISVIAVTSSFRNVERDDKGFHISILLLETGMLGVFLARDLFLFYIFWEVMLIPMTFLIGIWGHERRIYAAVKFILYTVAGSLFMLLGFLVLYFNYHAATGVYSFDLADLAQVGVPAHLQFWAFLALFVGFAIKVPLFPFHTWLPDAHVEAPTAGSIVLAGVLLKMGVYGYLRISIPLMPEMSVDAAPFIAAIAIIGIIYGALLALAQKNMKKLVAYSSISHLGFVVLGVFALNPQGIEGSILQMVNHGLSTGALFLLVGILYERRHTLEMADYGGMAKQVPRFAAIFGIIMLASIGLPGLNGFVGELLILIGAFKANMLWAVLASTGIVLGAVYMLTLFRRTMYGPLENPANESVRDLTKREFLIAGSLAAMCLWIGLFPGMFLKPVHAPTEAIVETVNRVVRDRETDRAAIEFERRLEEMREGNR
jgi:NADH-quinone oxidoreductase subunit M